MPEPSTPTSLNCLSWNVHRGRGGDGRVDPARILCVLAEATAAERIDVLALQEADENDRPFRGFLDIKQIEAATGLVCAHDGPELRLGDDSHGFQGSIVFLAPHLAVRHARVIDLPGHCHRGAMAVEAETSGVPVRIAGVHLSRLQVLRMAQLRTLGQYLDRRPQMRTILLGDFNEWRPWLGLAFAERLVGRRFSGPSRPSFPVERPLLALDRILADAPGAVSGFTVLDGPAIRAASDHRPVRARVALG